MQGFKISRDGVKVYTKALIAQGWEPCKFVNQLCAVADQQFEEDDKDLHYIGPKLPASLLKQVLGTIRQFPLTETGFLLYINFQTGDWHIDVSPQTGNGASVTFEYKEPPKGYVWVGTIHTHPEMPAFWSGTDTQDQSMRGGLHIVFGLTQGKPNSELISLFGLHSGQTRVEPADVYEELVDYRQDYDPNEDWVKTIKEKTMQTDTSYSDSFKTEANKEYTESLEDLPDYDFDKMFKKCTSDWHKKWRADEVALRDNVASFTLCDLLMDITHECKDKEDIASWIKNKRPDVYDVLKMFHLA